jgi:predicted nucleic acid-binding protein
MPSARPNLAGPATWMADRFVLDTDILAELEHPAPHPVVLAWLAAQAADGIHLTATFVAELWYGIELKPEGARCIALPAWLVARLDDGFADRILPFDAAAARIWGRLMAEGRRAGRPPAVRNAEIAAVALAPGQTVATRNVRDFASFDWTRGRPARQQSPERRQQVDKGSDPKRFGSVPETSPWAAYRKPLVSKVFFREPT